MSLISQLQLALLSQYTDEFQHSSDLGIYNRLNGNRNVLYFCIALTGVILVTPLSNTLCILPIGLAGLSLYQMINMVKVLSVRIRKRLPTIKVLSAAPAHDEVDT